MKMMVTTRKCMDDLQEQLFAAQHKLVENVDSSRNEAGND
jgi:hypothetical protein